jgi:Family of unknown function (DUF5985)
VATAVYVLCALTSAACAVLLWRGWAQSRAPLLLWSAVCFAGLALNNVLLFMDKVVAPDVDLSTLRLSTALAAVSVLLVGLIWESVD